MSVPREGDRGDRSKVLPVGTRVWKRGSGTGPTARFGLVVVVPTCYICEYFAKPENGNPPVHGHGFSVRFDNEVWEILDITFVEPVTSDREAQIQGAHPVSERRARRRAG